MTDEPEFLRRWSRRKRAAREAEDGPSAPEPEDFERTAEDKPEPGDRRESPAGDEEPLELPDIDSLTADSDFTPFMKPGVPTELKNRALRKLWRVNPVFGHLDGLNDYDGDFTDAATVVKDLKTLYKVGRGFLPDPEEQTAEAESAAPPGEDSQDADKDADESDALETGDADGEDEAGNNIS